MKLPPPSPDTQFEDLLQDLPPELIDMAYEFKAFTRSRKIKTPTELLRVVLLYCGQDQTLREVAGTLTLLHAPITDSSIAERLAARAWRCWGKSTKSNRMTRIPRLPLKPGDTLVVPEYPSHRKILDSSSMCEQTAQHDQTDNACL